MFLSKLIKAVIIIFAATLFVITSVPVNAQGEIKDAEGMYVRLIKRAQDPDSKKVRFDTIVYSRFDSDRVQLTWEVDGPARITKPRRDDITGSEQVDLTLLEGEVQKRHIIIQPVGFGEIDVKATVEAFQVDGTRVASASMRVGADRAGNILPAEPLQNVINAISAVQSIATYLAIAVFLYVAGTWGYKRFRQWLYKREQRV